jgi:hypothetical protein
MKYLLNHKDGIIELNIKNAYFSKNKIENGSVTA